MIRCLVATLVVVWLALSSIERVGAAIDRTERERSELFLSLLLSLFRVWGRGDVYRGLSLSASTALSVVLVDRAMRRSRLISRQQALFLLREAGAKEIPRNVQIGDTYPRGGANIYDVWTRPSAQFRYYASQNPAYRESSVVQRELLDIAERIEEFIARDRTDGETAAWRQFVKPRPVDPAVNALTRRVITLAETDLQLASRDEIRRTYDASTEVRFTRRIIHPERSATGTCGLCVAAASRLYKKKELLPLHNGCRCTTAPVVGKTGGDGDPGFYLNEQDLRRLYEAAGSTAARDLVTVRVRDVPHGELGQLLVSDMEYMEKPRFDPLATQWRDVDDSTDMWMTVGEIAESRLEKGGTESEVAAHEALAATAASHGG